MESRDRASEAASRSVADVIKLQRRIFNRHRKLIETQEAHKTKSFSRYRNEYRKAVSGYESEIGFGALCDAVAGTRVAYVADYHTLQLAQKTLVKLIVAVLQQANNLCLAMEFVNKKYQDHLDKYLEGKIKEKTFLSRIRYREQWPYDIWPNFKPILDLAMEHGLPVVAIDSDVGSTLASRDKLAAVRIAEAARQYPDATIIVSAGQMHMAPSHLPAKVDRAFAKEGLEAPDRVIVYQNAEEIYWQLAGKGREEVEVVQVGPGEYCINNTPPLVQQLSYLHWIHFDEELIEYTQLEQTVRALLKDLARYLDIDIGDAVERVRVLMPADFNLMGVLEEAPLTKREKRWILQQVESEESICIPGIDLICLATLSVNHAAEESAHYLKHLVSGGHRPEEARDFFYFIVLNEACAFFGSKLVNPKRKAAHAGRLRSIVAKGRKTGDPDAEALAAKFALEHISWERSDMNRKRRLKTALVLGDQAVFNAAAHFLGYILGDRLYYGLTDGVIEKELICALFIACLEKKSEAFKTYMGLTKKVCSVKIPRRI